MADTRTRQEKLKAMAQQTDSPHEAEVARKKLEAMGVDPDEPMGRKTKARPEHVRSKFWDSEWFKQFAEDFIKQDPRGNTYYRDIYGPPFGSNTYADDDPTRNTSRRQADEMYRRTRDQWRDESRKKFDHEVRFVGGPWDGQVHADPRNAEWRVVGHTTFKAYWTAELDDSTSYKDGTYSREVDGEGKPFYLWKGWRE